MRFRDNAIPLCVVLGLAVVSDSYGHSGRTDASGGHWNRKTGTYHYHNAGTASPPSTFALPSRPLYRSSARTTSRSEARQEARDARSVIGELELERIRQEKEAEDERLRQEAARQAAERKRLEKETEEAKKAPLRAAAYMRAAEFFQREGEPEKGEKWLRKILADYQQTEAAVEARRLLGIAETAVSTAGQPAVGEPEAAGEGQTPRKPEPLEDGFRTWTDNTGKFTRIAELISFNDETTWLRDDPGNVIAVPTAKLSQPDRQFILGLTHGLPSSATVMVSVDGDTFKISTGDSVRLIGVDTPETVHPTQPVERFGKEAAAFTESIVAGKPVVLAYDQANAATKHRDRYGRLLAYVVRSADNLDVNAELIRQGYAHAYTQYPFSRMDEFRAYEREAREQSRGLWAPMPPPSRAPPAVSSDDETATVYVTRTGAKYHRSGCRYLRNSSIPMELSAAKQRYSPCSVCKP